MRPGRGAANCALAGAQRAPGSWEVSSGGGPGLCWAPQGTTPCPLHLLDGHSPPGTRGRRGYSHETCLSSQPPRRVGSHTLSVGTRLRPETRVQRKSMRLLGFPVWSSCAWEEGAPAPQSQAALRAPGFSPTPDPFWLSDHPQMLAGVLSLH